MNRGHTQEKGNFRRLCAMLMALALALTLGIAAMAEQASEAEAPEAQETQTETQEGLSEISETQEAAEPADAADVQTAEQAEQIAKEALAAYDLVEEEVLSEMVAAGALTQETVNDYLAQRNAQRTVAQMDTSGWTVDQLSAMRMGVGRGSVNETVLAGLLAQGAITQEDAVNIRLAYGESVDIWSKADTSKTTEAMLTKLREAQAAYRQAVAGTRGSLRGAGKTYKYWSADGELEDVPAGMGGKGVWGNKSGKGGRSGR